MPEDANSFSEITGIDCPGVVTVNRDGRSRAFRIRFSADGPIPHIRVVLRSSPGEYVVNEANIAVRPLTGGAASCEVTIPHGVLATGDAQIEIAACRIADLRNADLVTFTVLFRRAYLGLAA